MFSDTAQELASLISSIMEFLKPRSLKARQRALGLIMPCLRDVQDDLGNVPVTMQQDDTINGSLIGAVERVCNVMGVTRENIVARVVAEVFEEIYRREATEVLTRCDGLLEDTSSTAAQMRQRTRDTDDGSLSELAQYVQDHYERPDILVL